MKQKLSNSGFTLVELLVVVAIMASLTGLFLVNFAGTRGPRNLKIAQNELVTNLRKIQSYTLSARDVNDLTAARYYIIRLAQGTGDYQIQAIGVNKTTSVETYFDGSSASQPYIETFRMPSGISVTGLKVTNGSGVVVMDTNGSTATLPPQCVQAGMSLPFGKAYVEYSVTGACNFLTVTTNAATLNAKANHALEITLRDSASGQSKRIILRGVTGIVESQ